MSNYKRQDVTGLHDNTTGALVGFLGADGNEYLMQTLQGPSGISPELLGYRTGTAATDTVGSYDATITYNFAGTVTVTLPAASANPGRILNLRTITANTVISASSNVVPAAGGAAGTAILAGTAGKCATLQSDGTNWQIISAN